MSFRHYLTYIACLTTLALHTHDCTAGVILPSIIGEQSFTTVAPGESLMEIARRTGFGYEELALANQHLDPWIPPTGALVTLPGRAILPVGSAIGLTINLAEMRLYHVSDNAGETLAKAYPLGIGRTGRETPEGDFRVINKEEDPVWRVPAGLRALHPELPAQVPPGPSNPLGRHWLGLSVPGYGIHGTNRPLGVGRRVSYGCIRLYPDQVKELYARVSIGTPVTIVYQPVKVGWQGENLYMEVHPDPLGRFDSLFQEALRVISRKGAGANIDYRLVNKAVQRPDGLLHPVGVRLP